MLLLALAALSAAAAALIVARELAPERRALRHALHRASESGGGRPVVAAARADVRARRFSERVATTLIRVVRTTPDAVEERLRAAGFGGHITAAQLAAGWAVGVTGAAVGGAALGAAAGPTTAAGLALVFGLAAAVLPARVLRVLAAKRRERMRAALPNALDLLAVFVEAGLGVDAALAKVTGVLRGPLADELARMLGEMRAGVARSEALRRFADRLALADATSFVRAVVQSAELGTSLAGALRGLATDARARRQAETEERVGRAPVQMLFPTVLFIFPAVFVVVLGPALMALARLL